MTNYREILRLHSLGLNKTEIASSCRCARNTVAATLQRAANCGLQWPLPEEMSDKQLSERLFPSSTSTPVYKMPDYEWVHREMQKNGVTLSLLWVEYCEQCHQNGELPYKSTQFNKYYADYVHKTKATVHFSRCSRSLEDLIGNLVVGFFAIGFFEKLFLESLQSFIDTISGILLSASDHLCDVLLELRLVG